MTLFDRAWLPAPAFHQTCISTLAGSLTSGERRSVPNGFPKTINADMVWSGAALQHKSEVWRICLTKEHIRELEEAAAGFEGIMIESHVGWVVGM